MITSILSALSNFIITVIEAGGYAGIFVLMFLQSINIPLPSEIIMPFSGFLAYQGSFNFWVIVLTGAVANVIGSLVSYNLAAFLVGDGLREKYRIIRFLLNDHSISLAQKWFTRYGAFSVFLGRITPVINTFISFPAGLAKMPLRKFVFFTATGSLVWNFFLTGLGFTLGENWTVLEGYFRKFDYVIVMVIVIVALAWLWHHFDRHPQKAGDNR